MSSDRLAAMEIFVRVVDTGSFSAAATQLGVGQPAVSKTIGQLEERLGARLLIRSTRNLSLTDAGRSFYENARRAIDGVNLAEQAVREEAGLEGTLRVSASVCFSRIHLMPRLPEFLAEHPGLQINALVDDRFVNLAEEGIDLALRTGTLTETSLNVRKIGESQRRVMATRGYWEAHGKPRSLEDLGAHEFVVLERSGKPVDEWTFRKGALAEAVLAGLGVAVVSEWLFSPELATGACQRVLEDWSLPVQDLWAVFPQGGLASAKARALVKFVERCMAAGYAGASGHASAARAPA